MPEVKRHQEPSLFLWIVRHKGSSWEQRPSALFCICTQWVIKRVFPATSYCNSFSLIPQHSHTVSQTDAEVTVMAKIIDAICMTPFTEGH